ncbi:SBBP repeat-containing protein [Paraburkholderia phytofirmans]|uniref:SMP-30/Gluconolactonase/LRE-like region domain-containing protein n=1 Tax=Paraburkholderia phytofirmans (strain DSM 17436 / LMG 22146 / PsJN) TaxID=398527 RepID=B2SZJ8_PARPJ|nr:SBBP repeat-containing protein [Paraburkholderia phytofirmans]ACD17186.1 hypothetical protein Bphyt_2792 [Paraburkholderia phytofirmans PsJN]
MTTLATGLTTASNAIAVDKQGNVYTAGSRVIYRRPANGSIASYPFTATSDFITSMTRDSAGNLFVGTRGVGAQILKITFL